MTPSALLFWLRTAGEVALAGGLLAAEDVASLEARLPLLPALVLGALVGIGLVVLLARRPPPVRVDRARIPLVSLKAGVIAVGSAAEEVIWRWFAIGSLSAAIGIVGAYVASTLGFALAHGRRPAFVHLLTGASFGAVYLLTGRLAAAAAAHVAYNLRTLLAVESSRPWISISASSSRPR